MLEETLDGINDESDDIHSDLFSQCYLLKEKGLYV